jgi:hypothetical protein
LSCFALPESFGVVPRASRLVFKLGGIRLILGSTEGVGSHFHVLRSRTRFRWYRGRRVRLSCFTLLDSFLMVTRAPGPIFMFCAPWLVFDNIEDVGSHLHVLPSRTHFGRYHGRRVPFSCFALLESFSMVPRKSGPVFKYCTLRLVFDGTEGVGSRFHLLCSRTRLGQYRGRQVSFSWFTLSNSISTEMRALDLIFMVCAPGFDFSGNEGAGSRFHVLRSRTHFGMVPRASGPVFMVCAPGLNFDGIEGARPRLHVLRSRARFRRYRGRQVPFSCFELPESFSTVPRAPGLVFMFCAP